MLKIDMKFLSRSPKKTKSGRILRSIINLAEDLGFVSLIEGVETEGQYTLLSGMGCMLIQGFFIGEPMDTESFELFLILNISRE